MTAFCVHIHNTAWVWNHSCLHRKQEEDNTLELQHRAIVQPSVASNTSLSYSNFFGSLFIWAFHTFRSGGSESYLIIKRRVPKALARLVWRKSWPFISRYKEQTSPRWQSMTLFLCNVSLQSFLNMEIVLLSSVYLNSLGSNLQVWTTLQ